MRLLPEKLWPAGFIRKKLKFMLTARQRFTNISRLVFYSPHFLTMKPYRFCCLFLAFFFLNGFVAFAQVPAWQWATGLNASNSNIKIASDPAQNTYVSTFHNMLSGGLNGSKITKYDAGGNLLWTKDFPETSIRHLATDPAGNVYLTGSGFFTLF